MEEEKIEDGKEYGRTKIGKKGLNAEEREMDE